MKEQIEHLEFVVNSLDEIKTLCDAWDRIAGAAFRRTRSNTERALDLANYATVVVYVRGREPGREVFLVFMSPRAMMERFFKSLRHLGLEFTKEVDEEESVTICRLTPVADEP